MCAIAQTRNAAPLTLRPLQDYSGRRMDCQTRPAPIGLGEGATDPVSRSDSQGTAPQRLLVGVAQRDPSRRKSRRRIRELVIANRRKDELLAIVCHELRGPLASIHYAARLLASPDGNGPVREQVHALLQRQAGRMTRLVDDLLDMSRITRGRLQLQCSRIDLRLVVKQAIESLSHDIEAREQQLTLVLPDAPVWLAGDAFRLEQVFVNLLANAVKYTPRCGRLAIDVHVRDDEAIARISDSGVGIAPQLLPRIFDLFTQTDDKDVQYRAGLGVGLAVVRSLVGLHGGSVTAASRGHGQGSEFTVSLPREE